MVEFGGRYTYAQVRAARGPVSGLRKPFFWMGIVVLLVLGAGLLPVLMAPGPDGKRPLWPVAVPAAVALLYVVRRISDRRAFETSKGKDEEVRGSADARGLELRSAGATMRTEWSGFVKVLASKDTVLLYNSDRSAVFFPRAFFASDEDWTSFVGWARAGIPKEKLVHWPTIWKLVAWIGVVMALLVAWTFATRNG